MTTAKSGLKAKKRGKMLSYLDFAQLFEVERSGSFLAYILLFLTLEDFDP